MLELVWYHHTTSEVDHKLNMPTKHVTLTILPLYYQLIQIPRFKGASGQQIYEIKDYNIKSHVQQWWQTELWWQKASSSLLMETMAIWTRFSTLSAGNSFLFCIISYQLQFLLSERLELIGYKYRDKVTSFSTALCSLNQFPGGIIEFSRDGDKCTVRVCDEHKEHIREFMLAESVEISPNGTSIQVKYILALKCAAWT